MQSLRLTAAVFMLFCCSAFATPGMPRNGVEYLTLPLAQSTEKNGDKAEVIEFFMYHCPACNAIEPALGEWLQKNGERVAFKRIHLPHAGNKDPEAQLFLTLQAMGKAEALHAKVLQSWHVERHRLNSDAENLAWAVRNGLNRDEFLRHYQSPAVKAGLKGLTPLVTRYYVDSTPTFIVGGKYLTMPTLVGESNPNLPSEQYVPATFQVLDFLVEKARRETAH